jgi:hypothetical protein
MSKFQKGVCPNPSGRPKGSISTATKMKAALDSYGTRFGPKNTEQVLLDVIIGRALEGDGVSQKIIIDRLIPIPKARAENVALSAPLSADPVEATAQLTQAVSNGEINVDEAARLSSLISLQIRATEHQELTDRIKHLEQVAGIN